MYLVREPAGAGRRAAGGPGAGPALLLFLTEPARGLADLAALPLAAPWLARAGRGDGHGVLVLPGLLASDFSTAPLRRFLCWLGYDVHGWELGRNQGPTEAVRDGLPLALAILAARAGGPVSLVGWSLGGIYARELAREHPDLVRHVITLGSPFAVTDLRRSRADGIVCWQNCIEPETALHQNVAVRCSHLGFGVDPATLWLIADRLAAPAGQPGRFRPPAWL